MKENWHNLVQYISMRFFSILLIMYVMLQSFLHKHNFKFPFNESCDREICEKHSNDAKK